MISSFHLGWCEFLVQKLPSACKTCKQPEELIAPRKLVVDAMKWWMQMLQLAWDGVSFRVEFGGEAIQRAN